jgi:hypothetical protein
VTVYELAAFPILISSTIVTIILTSKDVISSAIAIPSAATLGEHSSGSHANDRQAQSKSN